MKASILGLKVLSLGVVSLSLWPESVSAIDRKKFPDRLEGVFFRPESLPVQTGGQFPSDWKGVPLFEECVESGGSLTDKGARSCRGRTRQI